MALADPLRINGAGIDLSGRIFRSATVAASPSAATETTICTLTIPAFIAVNFGIILQGFAAFTVGTSGVSANLKIRQTDTSGTTLKATGATTVVAANLVSKEVTAVDTSPSLPNQVYVLTLTIGSGAAASTVSAVELIAQVV